MCGKFLLVAAAHSFLKFNFPNALLMYDERSCGLLGGAHCRRCRGSTFGTNVPRNCRRYWLLLRHRVMLPRASQFVVRRNILTIVVVVVIIIAMAGAVDADAGVHILIEFSLIVEQKLIVKGEEA